MLGDEPHAPYNRILLSAVLAGTHDRVDSLALRLAGPRRPPARRAGRRDRPGGAGGRARRPARACRTTRWCWPPAASRPCRRSGGSSGSTAGSTSGCTRSAPSTTACGSTPRSRRLDAAARGGRRRRRAARARGRPRPGCPRPEHRGRRGRRPPAAQPGRRQGRRDPRPRPRSASGPPSTPAPGPPGSPRRAWSSTTASSSTPTWSC